MNILINASNLKVGGGIQVADSICRELYKYTNQHNFFVVLPAALEDCAKAIENSPHIKVFRYNIKLNLAVILTNRDPFLDKLVSQYNIKATLTVFGPSFWTPQCPHICGFAISHLLLKDSPFFKSIRFKEKLKQITKSKLREWLFRKNSNIYYTENPFISHKLQTLFPKKIIYTITNNYNQVFDTPDYWDRSIVLPPFKGITLLTICANYPHKNLSIIVPCIRKFVRNYPSLHIRFVLTIKESDYIPLTEEEKRYIIFLGPVKINQCPNLYQQADIMLLPTLLECFSASYAEAMKMRRPIITTDLGFAHSLCGDAAEYYQSTSPKALADSIYKVSTDRRYYDNLVESGIQQLKKFDTYEERTMKLIKIMEELNVSNNNDE